MSPHPVIIEGLETEAGWDRHRAGIIDHVDPQGSLELELADRLATLTWRLRRVTRFETAVINHQVADTANDLRLADRYLAGAEAGVAEPAPLRVAAYKELRVIPSDSSVDKIMKYEAHLHRQCLQVLHELEALQARRRGEPTPLARLDISSPPGT